MWRTWKKFRKKLYLLGLFLLFSIQIFAQNTIFEHYTVEDGLPSSEIYSQLQDDEGYMWFATSRGVCRFDGFEFKTFTMKNGLPSNSIIKLYKDYKGRIWFSSYEGYLSYYENEKIIQHPLNDTITKISKNYYVDNLCIDNEDNLWFTPNLGGIYIIDKQLNISEYKVNSTNEYKIFIEINENGHLWNNNFENTNINNNNTDTTTVISQNNKFFINFKPNNYNNLRRYFYKIDDNEFILSYSNKVIYIKNNNIVATLEYNNEVSGVFADDKNNFWISVMYQGIYMYENKNLYSFPIQYLKGKSPISVFQDIESNYWFSTTEDGIYFVPSFQFNTYYQFGFSDYNILSMHKINNTLYFSTYDKQLFRCNVKSDKILSIENIKLPNNNEYPIIDILADYQNNIWLLGSELIKITDTKINIIDTIPRAYNMSLNKNGQLMVCVRDGYLKYDNENIIDHNCYNEINSANYIYQDDNNNIWIGTLNGLFRQDEKKMKFFGEYATSLKSRVNEIKQIGNYILIATSGEGLILIKDTIIVNINKNNGLNSNFVTSILVDSTNICWIGTNKGLCKIVFDLNNHLNYKMIKYTKANGLFSEEIKDLIRIDNCIWLGTSKGIISFFPDNLKKNNTAPSILLDSIVVDNKKIELKKEYIFKNHQNSIFFFFKAISFKATPKIKYRYKLEGFDEKWIESDNRYVRFPNLPPGDYIFRLTAASEDDNWNTEYIVVKFKIKKHFSQTNIFIATIFLASILIVILIILFIYKNLKKDIDNKKNILIAEHKALRAQMNPHFIFNSLNSIRRYILENDNELADNYLTSFATLMRLVLENSKYNFIDLNTEIETLKRYLQLEKMRFNDTFNFEIIINPDINPLEIKIPPMLIQPYLENAIWHGLAPKKNNGNLLLEFNELNNNILICIIQDNGIGREKAKEIAKKRTNHNSTGLINIQERILLINKFTNSNTTVQIIDLYNDNNEPTGTKIILKFPYNAFIS